MSRPDGKPTNTRRDVLADHLADPKSLRKAINAYCFGCVGGDADSQNPYRLVRECAMTHCELHTVRPWQQKDKNEPEETADLSDDEEGADATSQDRA